MNSITKGICKKNIIIRAISLMMIFYFCSFHAFAQDPTLAIGSVGMCDNSTVLVPVTGNNLLNVGAITLYIDYDPLELAFDAVENVNPQLTGLMVNNLPDSSRISVVWSKTSGASFMNASLFNLKFQALNLPCNLTFIKNHCEIANISIPPQILPVTFSDGSVFPSLPVLASGPDNKTISSQTNAVFQVESPNATGYTWQEQKSIASPWTGLTESAPYSGTTTNTLTVGHVPASFDQYKYRCILSLSGCQVFSPGATLTVDSLAGISGLPGHDRFFIKSSPNPFTDRTTVEYSIPENGFVTLRILTPSGQVMATPVDKHQPAGSYRLADNCLSLPAGIYFCELALNATATVYLTHWKMIKTNQK